jgi:hypothetical protein
MARFARLVEEEQAAVTANVPRHARNILKLGEMIGVASARESILPMLPPRTRAVFGPLHSSVRPRLPARLYARALGRVLMPKAVGAPRKAVPLAGS